MALMGQAIATRQSVQFFGRVSMDQVDRLPLLSLGQPARTCCQLRNSPGTKVKESIHFGDFMVSIV